MADISAIKPTGTSGASYNIKDATARTNIGTLNNNVSALGGRVTGLDTRVTALEKAGGGLKIYRIAGPAFAYDEIENGLTGVVKWDSENRAWTNDYDDVSFYFVPLTSLMPSYPNTTAPSVNVGDILISFSEGYGNIRSVLAVMNSRTVPSIVQNCINARPDTTAAEKTAFYNSLASMYNTYGTMAIVAAGAAGAGVFGYFYEG